MVDDGGNDNVKVVSSSVVTIPSGTTTNNNATGSSTTTSVNRPTDHRTSLILIPSYSDFLDLDGDDDDNDASSTMITPDGRTIDFKKQRGFTETRRGVRNAVKSIRISHRLFDISVLPADLLRVYNKLKELHDEDYALLFVFIVRTAVELHRAWHLTLLTSKILQRIKQKFGIRCTWTLGVTKLVFRVDDGAFELHRKVPYDYDSEYQDLYMRLAEALVEGHISIHEALIYQSEIKQGLHTAPSGKFLRNFPGRILLYPLEAATCSVIFFDGDWIDAGVAAICGLAAGSIEWALSAASASLGSAEVKILIDVLAGASTGIIGGFFIRFVDYPFCLSASFLGTLYWFFYGTAFVVGMLEIIAGELETGVTRFVSVMVKTFVLSLCSAIGLMIVVNDDVYDVWIFATSDAHCKTIDLNDVWWRIPLYLLCSASALGQYRMPLAHYWRGLIVQLVGYEVQYQVKNYLSPGHSKDFLDTASANLAGAGIAVVVSSILRWAVDSSTDVYISKLLKSDPPTSFGSNVLYRIRVGFIKLAHCLGLGRKSDIEQLELKRKLQHTRKELLDPNHPRQEIILSRESEKALIEAVVESQGINLWALLMPTIYQLVPGSLLAKLWYNIIFPPPLTEVEQVHPDSGFVFTDRYALSPNEIEASYGLWIVSLSLALGLVLGNTVVSTYSLCWNSIFCRRKHAGMSSSERLSMRKKERFQQQGVMESDKDDHEEDPSEDGGGMTDKKTDEPIVGKLDKEESRLGGLGVVIEDEKKDDSRPTTIPPSDQSMSV